MRQTTQYPRGCGRRLTPPGPELATAQIASSEEPFELVAPEDPKVARRVNQIELAEQITYFDQVRACLHPRTRLPLPHRPGADCIYAVPNSNVAGVAVGVKLVRSGLSRGYPDINIDFPREMDGLWYPGARIELKQPQGVPSDVRDEQRAWLARLGANGFKAVACFGWREAWAFTRRYMGWHE